MKSVENRLQPQNQTILVPTGENSQLSSKNGQLKPLRCGTQDKRNEDKFALSPTQLNWADPGCESLATRRMQSAQEKNLPYVLARQKTGSTHTSHDGSMAYEQVLSKPTSIDPFDPAKSLQNSASEDTHFFCLLPGHRHLTPMGSVDEMFAKGLNGGEIGTLLGVNEFLSEKVEDEEVDAEMEAEWLAVSRASFFLLNVSGNILPKDERAAEAIISPLSDEERKFAMANVMAISAGSNRLTLLKIALNLGYDPDQRSRLVEATPFQHAEIKGNEKARQLLLSFRLKQPLPNGEK